MTSEEVVPVEIVNRGKKSVILILERRSGEPRMNEVRVTPGQSAQVWIPKDGTLLVKLEPPRGGQDG